MIWVRINGRPARQFYRAADAVPFMVQGQARHALLKAAGTIRSGTDGEASNLTITLDNGSGQCARLFALPPLNAIADVFDDDRLIFTGTVRRIELEDDCRVSVQA